MNTAMVTTPANTEGPISMNKKYTARMICRGADHSICSNTQGTGDCNARDTERVEDSMFTHLGMLRKQLRYCPLPPPPKHGTIVAMIGI